MAALPDQLFYNTGISTYFWILTNRKSVEHKGEVVLLDAHEYWQKMRKYLDSELFALSSSTAYRTLQRGQSCQAE